jgi:hypothetical protein
VAIIIFGGILLIVDFVEGMPLWWSLGEGPINMVFGSIIMVLSNRIARGIRRTR